MDGTLINLNSPPFCGKTCQEVFSYFGSVFLCLCWCMSSHEIVQTIIPLFLYLKENFKKMLELMLFYDNMICLMQT